MARRTSPQSPALALDEPAPMINTTPLIDLMLVLLIIFIVSIPIATHKVPLDLPAPIPAPREPVQVHRIDLDAAGNLSWDGQRIAFAGLAPRLAQMAADPTAPELHIAADAETRYEVVDETLGQIRRSGITNMGFIGNERFAQTLDQAR